MSKAVQLNQYYSNEWCNDEKKARSQEELQRIAKSIRDNCEVVEIIDMGDYFCTVFRNNNLGLRYWIHDSFGHISTIDEERSY